MRKMRPNIVNLSKIKRNRTSVLSDIQPYSYSVIRLGTGIETELSYFLELNSVSDTESPACFLADNLI